LTAFLPGRRAGERAGDSGGATPDEAVADLRQAVAMVLDEDGAPDLQVLDLEVA